MSTASETPAERMIAAWVPAWPTVAAGADLDSPAATAAGGRITACTMPAQLAGVRRGQRLRDAQRLCPELEVFAADPVRESRVFEPVVVALEAAAVGVEVVRPGLCLLRAAGPSRFYGGEQQVAAVLRDAIADAAVEGVPGPVAAGVGIADGAFAAILAARTDTVVAPGASGAFLARFDVAVLDRPELAVTLRRLGVRRLEEFAALSADKVAARFGADDIAAHRLARGLDARPPAPRLPPVDLTVSRVLDPPVELVEQAMFAVKALAEQLHQRLAASGLVCDRVEIGALTGDGAESARWWRHGGHLSGLALAERCRWQLDAWTTTRRREGMDGADGPHLDDLDIGAAGFVRLWLRPDGLRLGGAAQPVLFGPAPLSSDAKAAIERLQNLFGHAAITRPALAGGRDPETRIVQVPFGDLMPDGPGEGPWPGRIPQPAPAHVAAACPVKLLDADGVRVAVSGRGELSAPPARLVLGAVAVGVTGFSEPWVASERTWRPEQSRRRVRMQILAADGRAFLLSLEQGAWTITAGYQ